MRVSSQQRNAILPKLRSSTESAALYSEESRFLHEIEHYASVNTKYAIHERYPNRIRNRHAFRQFDGRVYSQRKLLGIARLFCGEWIGTSTNSFYVINECRAYRLLCCIRCSRDLFT